MLSSCFERKSCGVRWTPWTPLLFCAVRAVMADMPKPPFAMIACVFSKQGGWGTVQNRPNKTVAGGTEQRGGA
jgi:hypothetical protein